MVFAVLANTTRRLILRHLLRDGALSVTTIAARIDYSPTATSQHLAKLRDTLLVTRSRSGHQVFYSVDHPDAITLVKTIEAVFGDVGR